MLGCMALVVVLSPDDRPRARAARQDPRPARSIRVSAADGRPFADYRDLAHAIADEPGILGASPYLQGEVMVRSGFQRQGGILLGIDPELHRSVSIPPDIMREGDYEFLSHPERIPSRSSASTSRRSSRRRATRPDAAPDDKGGGATGLPHPTGSEDHVPEDIRARPSTTT